MKSKSTEENLLTQYEIKINKIYRQLEPNPINQRFYTLVLQLQKGAAIVIINESINSPSIIKVQQTKALNMVKFKVRKIWITKTVNVQDQPFKRIEIENVLIKV